MSLSELSIRRPIFMTCVVLLSVFAGYFSLKSLSVDLFPNVTFPVVVVTTAYPGAGPSEIETLVTKPLEDEVSSISGIKRLTSINREGVSVIVSEFSLETDVKYAEQKIRDHVSSAKRLLPKDAKEPVIRRVDPADQPVLTLALKTNLPDNQAFDLADQVIRPKLEQVNQVGLVEIIGGRKREIHVDLNRRRLKDHELSVSAVAERLAGSGEDIPNGKMSQGDKETIFRTVGQFKSLDDIKNQIINFFGNDVPVQISDVGTVRDTLEDESARSFINGEKSLQLFVFRQSGSNTIAVADALMQRVNTLNSELAKLQGQPQLVPIRDLSTWIRANVDDVKESIYLGVILAVVVVFFFLGSGRSTIITGLALPNSLLGAFILMAISGFSINIMTLLALSLSVGLLIDDAIVVRENIFRHIEHGEKPIKAALNGTLEVTLAVVATTFTVIAVFGPLGFLKGVVGQFFKEFGLTVCFAMAISLFDALTMAPMLSAYFAGTPHNATHGHSSSLGHLWDATFGIPLRAFDRFQTWLENIYVATLRWTLKHPMKVLIFTTIMALFMFSLGAIVPKTFLPPQDAGEFTVAIDLPPGTNLDAMTRLASEIDTVIRNNKEVLLTSLTVGSRDGDANRADFYVKLVPAKQRKLNTSGVKQLIRDQLLPFAHANPSVKDYDPMGAGQRPFMLNIRGSDQKQIEEIAGRILTYMRANPGFKDADVNFRPGKPEFQMHIEKDRAERLGASTAMVGAELRAQTEGLVAAKFRENGLEYDVRVRLQDDQRDLKKSFHDIYVPNINRSLVRLSQLARPLDTEGPSRLNRVDRGRYVQLQADISPGFGIGNLMDDMTREMTTGSLKLPENVTFAFIGQAENFAELATSIKIAMLAGVLFIFLVLASLYESFVTPLTIMLALPLAICGSITALAITRESLNIFSMIGMIMLLGVATKNSILLVDFANQKISAGSSRYDAMIEAGRTRLRPILMTTMALIAGTLPIALGLNEASRQRTSMGVAIIGGLISSTLLTLIVVPAAFSYFDRFRVASGKFLKRIFMTDSDDNNDSNSDSDSDANNSNSNSSQGRGPVEPTPRTSRITQVS